MSTRKSPEYLADIDEDVSSQESSLRTSTAASSSGSPPPLLEKRFRSHWPSPTIECSLPELFGENVAAKIWRVADIWLEQDVSGQSCGESPQSRAAF